MKNQQSFLTATKTILTSALFASALLSCSKKDMQEPAFNEANTVASAAKASNSPLFIDETMESSSPFTAFGGGIEVAPTDYSFTFPNMAFDGKKSVRFEIRKDQPKVGSSSKIRSEVTIVRGSEYPNFGTEAWYSYAIYFPSVGFEPDAERDCINQWFEDGSDETTIRAQNDQVFLEVTPQAGSTTLKKYDLFASSLGASGSVASAPPTDFQKIPKNEWHEFVFHIVHSTGSDGLIEVWRDGRKIHNITGRNMHLKVPKWKIGLYKASFLNGTSNRNSRVLYFDNVRVGSSKATLADMMSSKPAISTPPPVKEDTTTTVTSGGPTTPIVAGQKVVSFTLVNSAIEKDILTIKDGARISLKKIGAEKLNIRANLANGTSEVVKMELSGAAVQSYSDNQAPYALFGDVNGNYKSWTAVAGKYSLKATVAGKSYKVNFTIEK